jgi:putative ABC transport system ATP-binding protein
MAAGIVDGVLDRLDLDHRREHRPEMMSGGEQQRLAFARAAVAGHRLVIADEPTAELDADSAEKVLGTIDHLKASGTSVVVATHDARVYERMDQVVTLRDGAVSSVRASEGELAVIDRTGRLQLPPNVAARYPARKARVAWDEETGRFTIEPP